MNGGFVFNTRFKTPLLMDQQTKYNSTKIRFRGNKCFWNNQNYERHYYIIASAQLYYFIYLL